ncbi:MAG: LamG-like jellyroll fold domain-containing protein [Crocinitomicaceae bacterium]
MKIQVLLFFLCITTFINAQIPAYVPVNGLKSYWPFSGNPNDISSNASHLTNSGAVLVNDRFGNPNSAYSFNGTNQYLTKTSPSFTFAATDDFTVSVWISKASNAGGVAMMNGSSASGNFIWLLQGGSTNMTFGTNKQQSAWTFIPAAYTINTWDHYVGVYQSGSMTFYKNGVVQSTGTMNHPNITSANLPFFVGRGINGSYFNGSIDDLGVWDRALTACEISDLYNSSQTLLTVNAGVDTTICSGSAHTLIGTGANTYVWDNSVVNGVSFNPITTQVYTVTGTDAAGCSGWDQMTITTIASQINAGSDQLICVGGSTTLSASGGTNYVWDNGVIDGVAFVPTTSLYTVTGTGSNGCTGSDEVLITQYTPPINAGPSSTNVCAGNSILLSGTGGISYIWDNNVTDSVAFIPTQSTLYTVIGTDTAGCTGTDQIQVNVMPVPIVEAGPNITICNGESVILTATGANGYTWNNNVSNGVAFSPTLTTIYNVIGANQSNCTNTDSVTVFVNQPTSSTLNISAIDEYILNGEIFTASGTYTQVTSNADGCDSTITLNLTLGFTGVNETENKLIQFYPNPINSILNIQLNNYSNELELYLYANDGRLIKKIDIVNQFSQFDLSELSAGIYLGEVNEKGNAHVKNSFIFKKN